MYYVSSHPARKPGSDFDLQSHARDKHKTGFAFLHYFAHLTSHCEVQPILYILFFSPPPSVPPPIPPDFHPPRTPLPCFKSPWMEPGLRCTIFPATVAVVLGPVQPHYFWEPNSHGPRNRRASSAFLALFPGIVSFVTSRAAFQPVNVCAGRSKFPVFSFRKGNLKFRMQPLFFSFSVNYVSPPPLFYVFDIFFLFFVVRRYIQRYTNAINFLTSWCCLCM